MARKNDDRKAVARGHKAGGGKPHAGRPAVAKRAAPAGKPKAAPAPKGTGKPGAKGVAAPPPPAPRGKFGGRVLEHEPLARHTTYRIGGPARYLVQPADADDIVKALELARTRDLPWLALGLGSNLLVKDGGFPGVVIKLGKGIDRFEMKGATAVGGAGLPAPRLARRTAEAGFAGVERFIRS